MVCPWLATSTSRHWATYQSSSRCTAAVNVRDADISLEYLQSMEFGIGREGGTWYLQFRGAVGIWRRCHLDRLLVMPDVICAATCHLRYGAAGFGPPPDIACRSA